MSAAAVAGERRPIVIYRDHLLRFSEIWVRSQGEALQHFEPFYAGSKRRGDVPMPPERTFLVNTGGMTGRAAEALFKLADWAPALRRWMRGREPALLHAHYGVDGALVLPIARALRVPLIVTFHGYEATMRDDIAARSFYLHRKYLKRRKALIREGALFIAVSDCVRRHLLAQGYPAARTVTHYIGVDAGAFTPDHSVKRENIVLFVGRFDGLKGGAHVVRAMAEVQQRVPDAQLVMIGDGPERQAVEAQARQTLRNCAFLGFQPQDTVKAWLNRAKVLCNPSMTIATGECEAFGLVFLEAQAMGVPVVAYASGGVPEAVADGETGFLARERDVPGLAAGIRALLASDDTWHRFSEAGRRRVRQDFAIAQQTRQLEQLYRETLAQYRVGETARPDSYPKEAPPRDASLGIGTGRRL